TLRGCPLNPQKVIAKTPQKSDCEDTDGWGLALAADFLRECVRRCSTENAGEVTVANGFFRIVKPSTVRATADIATAPAESAADKIERVAGKAVKLVPGEIIGLHASVTSLWVGDQ